jgi:hypothetical protein
MRILLTLALLTTAPAFASEKTDQKEEAAFLDGIEVGIPDGVIHSRARDQQSAENCWAFTMCGLMEGEYHKAFAKEHTDITDTDKRGYVVLSPFYLTFYHYYFQLRDNVPYYDKLRAQFKDPSNTALRDQILKTYATLKAAVRHLKRGEATPEKKKDLFQPDVGNTESVAMKEISEVGAMPASQFTAAFPESEQENRFEGVVPGVVQQLVFNSSDAEWENLKKNLRFGKKIGFQDPIYNALNAAILPVLAPTQSELAPLPENVSPDFKFPSHALTAIPTPTTTFTYLNLLTNKLETYTPRAFLVRKLAFNPHKYRSFVMTTDNIDTSLAAIVDNLKAGYATPIGISLFDDVNPEKRNKRTATERSTAVGVFDDRFCAGVPADAAQGDDYVCRGGTDAHEMLAVDWMKPVGGRKIVGILVKNSWGDAGLDVNGNSPLNKGYNPDPAYHGFYLILKEWLRSGTNVDVYGEGNIDFVIREETAQKWRSKGLVPERVKNAVDIDRN